MLTRVLPIQVPRYWELIKYSLQQTEKVGIDATQAQFNDVFADLLSSKCQCFIKSDGSIAQAVLLLHVKHNQITNSDSIHIRSLYVFSTLSPADWEVEFKFLNTLAKDLKCKRITFDTANSKLIHLAKSLGFGSAYTNMTYTLEV